MHRIFRASIRRQASLLAGIACVLAGTAFATPGRGAPPAEAWLPTNTLAYVTVPSAIRYRQEWPRQSLLGAWADPALKPFRDGFERSLERQLLAPLAELTGWHVGTLFALAEGQITYALLAPGPGGSNLVQVLLVDAGARTNEAAALFQSTLQPRPRAGTNAPATLAPAPAPAAPMPATGWSWSGISTGATYRLSATRLESLFEAAFPGETPPARAASVRVEAPPVPLHAVRLGTLLLGLTSTNDLPGIVARLAGAPPALVAPSPAATDPSRFTNTVLHAWLDGPACLRQLTRSMPPAVAALAHSGVPVPRILEALGFSGVQSVSWSARTVTNGWRHDLHVAVPREARKGLLQLLETSRLDAGPLPFLGDDVLVARRLRLPGPRQWAAFERTLRDLDPAWLGVLQLFTGYAGRTEDPDFDFEKQFLHLLGDDWVALTARVPATNLLTAELLLHGTTNATRVRTGLTQILAPTYLATFVPPDDPAPKRTLQTVAGHPLVSVEWPPIPWIGPGQYHFGQRGDWIAASGSRALIESFLAGPPNVARPLLQRPGVEAAIEAAGGAGGGWFVYDLERVTLREWFESVARSPEPSASLQRWASLTEPTTRALAAAFAWLDLRLLPPFGGVERHFRFRVTSGGATPEALHWTTFRPN